MRISKCKVCGVEIINTNRGTKLYCTEQCRVEGNKQRRSPATKRTCSICGSTFVSNGVRRLCSEKCQKVNLKNWWSKNKDRLNSDAKVRSKEWYLKNIEAIKERRQLNRDIRNEKRRKRYPFVRDSYRSYQNKWKEANLERVIAHRYKSRNGFLPPSEYITTIAINLLIKRQLKELKNEKHC